MLTFLKQLAVKMVCQPQLFWHFPFCVPRKHLIIINGRPSAAPDRYPPFFLFPDFEIFQ